jgi:pyruvate/2-oxoglutarate dehydrogenase complex dihydrolipoamide dehydrogenase (E3) component
MYELGVTLAKLVQDAGVEIRLNTPVTKEYVETEKVDALIIAVGSAPFVPSIPGLNRDNVVIVNDCYLSKEKITENIVVLGGGLAGCEAAIHFGQNGNKVHLVEMRNILAPDANIRHRPLLLEEIDKYVTVHTGYKALKVLEDGILCSDSNGTEQIVTGTTIICALGQIARKVLVDELRDTAPYIAIIGDCVRASTITNAIYQGYHAALDI